MAAPDFRWDDVMRAFIGGAFPWISQFKKQKIHFAPNGEDCSVFFNFCASLFASCIFIYSYYASPYQLLWLPSWVIFLLLSFVLMIAYFVIYFYFAEPINKEGKYKGLVITNLILYIFIFCCLTIGFGEARFYKDYYIISGRVTSVQDRKPINEADVLLISSNRRILQEQTNQDGVFSFFVKRDALDDLNSIQVNADGYQTYKKNFYGESSVFSYTKSITLSP